MTQQWISHSEEETAAIAQEIAPALPHPSIVFLEGNLGAGKTALARALLRHLTKTPDLVVPSPTYTLVQTYNDETIWHFDLYRMENPNDIYDIGWEEALQADLCLIEWADRLGDLAPKNAITIKIDLLPNDARRITMTS